MTTATAPSAPYAMPAGLKLNLGCGPIQPEGWVNVDASHRARLASQLPWLDRLLVRAGILSPSEFGPQTTVANLLRRFPWPENSVACIYAGELWEHFEYPDAVRVTAECVRVLAPGGVLRVCVPDGVEFWRKYLAIYERRDVAALHDHVALYFREICTRRTIRSMGHTHKWQFDDVQLIDLFERAGLRHVERMPFHRSRIPGVAQVERSPFLIVEGVKP